MKIGIAGGGLIGRLLAWRLLREGHSVTVFEPGPTSGELSAAFVAAAMLAPYSEAVTSGGEAFELGRDAVSQWRALLDELRADSGETVALNDSGSVVVAHERDRSSLSHFDQRLRAAVGENPQVESLQRAAIDALESELPGSFRQGLWLKGEGCLDNRHLLTALYGAIVAAGGEWRQAVVEAVKPGELSVEGTPCRFDQVIDSRGFGAKTQWPQLRGVRGEILWVRAPEVNLSRPVRLMHPRYHLYITPKPHQCYVVGATEIESESEGPVTVRSALELLSGLYSVHSGFAEAKILGAYARCRPALPDNLPRVRVREGLLEINGLYRHGYLLAPTILAMALDALKGNVVHEFVKEVSGDDSGQRQRSA